MILCSDNEILTFLGLWQQKNIEKQKPYYISWSLLLSSPVFVGFCLFPWASQQPNKGNSGLASFPGTKNMPR